MRPLLLAALLTVGCGASYSIVGPSGEKEAILLSETDRFAKLMGVDVRGEITDKLPESFNPYTAGWYSRGVAYYYRPAIQERVSLEECPNVAAHEVCHAKYPHHDLAHWNCMNKWAVPTYPRPE